MSSLEPVHKRTNHVPKAVFSMSPDPLRDWDRDLNYVRSQALQTPSQSRTGSAHCEVIFCSYCAVRANWPMHGFSAHFQNAHTRITFQKSSAFTCPQNQAFYANHDPKRLFFLVSKRVSKALFERALRSQRVKSGFQIRKGSESRSEAAFGTWFVPLWTGPRSYLCEMHILQRAKVSAVMTDTFYSILSSVIWIDIISSIWSRIFVQFSCLLFSFQI